MTGLPVEQSVERVQLYPPIWTDSVRVLHLFTSRILVSVARAVEAGESLSSSRWNMSDAVGVSLHALVYPPPPTIAIERNVSPRVQARREANHAPSECATISISDRLTQRLSVTSRMIVSTNVIFSSLDQLKAEPLGSPAG